MKLVKMSLAAAMLMGVNAFALENVKISGNAQLVYHTQDIALGALNEESTDLFDKDSSAADAALHLNVSADLTPGISAGASYTAVSTLGLENNFVSSIWGGSHKPTAATGATFPAGAEGALGAPGIKVENASWFDEAWLAATYSKTTAKLGRMQLDTPLAFSESWSVETNTFESIVALVQEIPDTTVVLAYIGNGNGNETFGQNESSWVTTDAATGLVTGATFKAVNHTVAAIVNEEGKFTTYGVDGAYAAAVINNSFQPLTVQAWYYDVTRLAQAFWVQADLSMEGLSLGGQFTSLTLDESVLDSADSDTAFAVMAAYEMKDMLKAKVAYSVTSDNDAGKSLGAAGFNTATSTGASKLYTEAWWNYGYIVRNDTSAFNVTLEGNVNGMFDLAGYYTATTSDASDVDMNELTVVASKTFGPLDASLVYIMTDADDQNDGDAYNIVQAYLTYNF
ncbi:MAG: hypothetical protein JXK05_09275 [Campylobacterales bacterium]|nr:hypothetical protein [Campylobacterales bacterium]